MQPGSNKSASFLFCCLAVLLSLPAHAQVDNEIFGPDNGTDYLLRRALADTPELEAQRVNIELNPSMDIARISAMVGDTEGNVYLFQRNTEYDPVIVLDRDGNVVRSFGAGLFSYPHGIRLDPQGNVWTVDAMTSRIVKFSSQGEMLLDIHLGDVPDITRIQRGAADIAFGPDGRIYVADGYGNGRIVVLNADGEKLFEWGQRGTGPGEFNLPHSLTIAPDGTVYVADRENGRIQLFSPDGEYLREWQTYGRPVSIDFAPNGDLFLSAEPRSVSMRESVLVKIDPQDGSFLGKIDGFGHQLSVGGNGALLPASLSDTVTLYFIGDRP